MLIPIPRVKVIMIVSVATLFLSSCAERVSPSGEGTFGPEAPSIGGESSGWSNVIGGEPTTADSSDVPFKAVTPAGLGETTGVFETDPEVASPSDRVIEFDFQNSSFGPVVVEELTPEVPTDRWERYVSLLEAQNGSEEMHGTASSYNVRNGSQALLTTSEDGTATDIRWLEGPDVEIWVRGPALTVDQCLEIAKSL